MNKARRTRIQGIIDALVAATAVADLHDLKTMVEEICEEEQEALDNRPESFQYSEAGERSQAAITALEEAADALGEAHEALDRADGQLNEAIEN